jgi:hypothetical protein
MSLSKYNIDALRREDGTYALADRRLVSGALRTEHVTHLQRDHRTVAMRRSVIPADTSQRFERPDKVLYTVDYSNRICQQFDRLEQAIDAVMDWLNQGEHEYAANDFLRVHCNQAWREATVLAVLGDTILIEGEMPGTTSRRETTFLRTYNVALGDLRGMRSVNYNTVPRKWINEMRAQDMDWIGMGQRMTQPLPFPRAD